MQMRTRTDVPFTNVVKALLCPFPVLQRHRSYPVTIYNIMIGAQGISAPSILDASNLRIRYLAGMSGSGRLYLARRWHSPRSITLEQIWCQELQTSQAKAILHSRLIRGTLRPFGENALFDRHIIEYRNKAFLREKRGVRICFQLMQKDRKLTLAVCVGVTYLPGPSPAKYCQHMWA